MMAFSNQAEEGSTVYGPVLSWRLGRSLGIDVLMVNSICSLSCAYCQLGRINIHTRERKVYVSTERVLNDLVERDWRSAEVITFSGSGEPTLAANLGEVIRRVKVITNRPTVVLTNSTTLSHPAVRRDLSDADRVFCKLDAVDEETFKRINRPVAGVTLCSVIRGIMRFRKEYTGYLAVQIMLLPSIAKWTQKFADILSEIRPDEVQLNIPSRPRPAEWVLEARANLSRREMDWRFPKIIGEGEARQFEAELSRMTRLKIVSKFESRTALEPVPAR